MVLDTRRRGLLAKRSDLYSRRMGLDTKRRGLYGPKEGV